MTRTEDNSNCFEKTKAGRLFIFGFTHKPKLNELNPLLFLRIVIVKAFISRPEGLTITTKYIHYIDHTVKNQIIMLSILEIKNSPETTIKWMCYNIFITIDNQVVNQDFNLLSEQLIGGSYCFYCNGKYRTKKWIRKNCVKVLGYIFAY